MGHTLNVEDSTEDNNIGWKKSTVFALFYFVFEGNFQVQAPAWRAYIWRGNLTEGFLRYRFGGLIFGGANTWRGLFSEFYGTLRCWLCLLHFHLPHISNILELLVLWKYILYKFIICKFAKCFAWNWHSRHCVKGGQQYRVKCIFIYFVFNVLKYSCCSKGCKLKLDFSQHFETQCETCEHQWINYTRQHFNKYKHNKILENKMLNTCPVM